MTDLWRRESMTQILTAIQHQSMNHLSDRLTSVRQMRFDPEANKTVIFRARDGIIAISFSGVAFLNGVPTDQWLAHVLRHEDPRTTAEIDHGAISGQPPARWLSIGEAIRALEQELTVARRHCHAGHVELLISGFQGKRGRRIPRPISFFIS